jgi:hypothetical protein
MRYHVYGLYTRRQPMRIVGTTICKQTFSSSYLLSQFATAVNTNSGLYEYRE